ncbi:MAG TPA: response regulator [Roseiflexaceae bacterium]|nr:response regulator [Roseiflexaceae bacterium]
MATSTSEPAREEFARWVQEVLQRLYDLPYLQKHPLTTMLAGADVDRLQRVPHLRRTLLDAIHALAPANTAQVQSPDWRAYRILELRYIEGLTPSEVMQQLVLSRSYYFREQARMLEALTTLLWEQWQQQQPSAPASSTDAQVPPEQPDQTREQLAHAETNRLSAHATWEQVDPIEVLQQLQPIVDSLARSQGKVVRSELPQQRITLRADRVLLRQALVTAITFALDVAADGQVQLESLLAPNEVGIAIVVDRASERPPSTAGRQGVGLEVCAQLMETMGGSLRVERTPAGGWEAHLVWPTVASYTLLVVDDNQDFVNLFRRYLAGHSWSVIGAADGVRARQVLAEIEPTVIILDVMMPREDGWELLVALRASEATRTTPILICSVLNEPRLAETLGASGYLTKPVNQQALLRALAPWSQADASRAQER